MEIKIEIDNDAANRVLEDIWCAVLRNEIIWTLTPADDSEWTKMPEEEATVWLQAILSGHKKMVAHYMDATQHYVPALRSV